MKRSCLLLVSGAISIFGIAQSAFAEPVTRNTEFSVTVNPYLNVTLSSNDVHLPITPSSGGTFGSTYFTATSSTNNALGYSLNLSIKDTNTEQAVLTTNLTSNTINVNDGTKPTIPTFSTNDILTSSQFSASTSTDHLNHWAMSLDDTDHYKKVLSESTIATSDGPIADDVTTLNLATKLDLLTPPGSYSAYFNFEIVANVARDSIDDDGKYPANSLLRAYEIAYTRAGKPMYVETDNLTNYPIGWRPMTDEDQPTIGGKEVRFAIQDITMTFEENNQTKNVCEWARSSSADNSYMDTALVMDLRDGTSYNIVKTAEGRCWLQDNLRLNLMDSGVRSRMSSSNTNASDVSLGILFNGGGRTISTHHAIRGMSDQWSSYSLGNNTYGSYVVPLQYAADKDKTSADITGAADPIAAASSWKFGIYYNYCAISAGYYCDGEENGNYNSDGTSTTTDDPDSVIDSKDDICPAGWRLPTSYDGTAATIPYNEYNTLFGAYGEEYSTAQRENARTALKLPSAGFYQYGATGNNTPGNTGYYPSSTRYGGMWMRGLYFNPQVAYLDDTNSGRQYGLPVRCINKNN